MLSDIYSHVNWSPSRRELRHFSWGLAGALCVFTLLVTWRGGAVPRLAWGTLPAAGMLVTAGLAAPRSLLPVYRGWMALTTPVGFAAQRLALILVFYALLTPIALVFKILGRDPLNRRLDRDADSYWIPHKPATDPKQYFRQF